MPVSQRFDLPVTPVIPFAEVGVEQNKKNKNSTFCSLLKSPQQTSAKKVGQVGQVGQTPVPQGFLHVLPLPAGRSEVGLPAFTGSEPSAA